MVLAVAGSEGDLLARHCPGLQYDSHEAFFTDSAAELVDARPPPRGNTLSRADGKILAASMPGGGVPQLELGVLGPQEYAGIGPVLKDDYLDEVGHDYVRDAARLHADPAYANRVYGHVAHDPTGAAGCSTGSSATTTTRRFSASGYMRATSR